MRLFTNKYKEDAIKWRNQENDRIQEENDSIQEVIEQEWYMKIEVTLRSGDTQYIEWKSKGVEGIYWYLKCGRSVATSGEEILRREFEEHLDKWGKVGVMTGDYFYPHSEVVSIQIKEVKKC